MPSYRASRQQMAASLNGVELTALDVTDPPWHRASLGDAVLVGALGPVVGHVDGTGQDGADYVEA